MSEAELNFYIEPGTDIYKVSYEGKEIEVLLLKDLGRGAALVEALYGTPFDRSQYFDIPHMSKRGVFMSEAICYSRKWE